MATTTEVQPEVRQDYVPPASEPDALTQARVDAYSPETAVAIRTPSDQNALPVADAGNNQLDLSTGNLFVSVFDKGDNVQLASVRTGDAMPGNERIKPSKETYERINAAVNGLTTGDTTHLQQYLKDMNDASDPRRQKELQAGMKELTKYLSATGLDAKMVMGSLSITLPGQNGKTLTIDKDGRTNLQGNDLRNFGQKLGEHLEGKDEAGPTISDRMTRRLDSIESGLRRTNLTGLQSAIKEIGDKIHSTKPGAAGAADRKEAGELQDMLGVLGDDLSRDALVDARYDRQTGSFSITQPDASGKDETLTIDKFGRANMSGEKLRFFLIRLRENQDKQPTMAA